MPGGDLESLRSVWNKCKKSSPDFEEKYDSKGLGRKLDLLEKSWSDTEDAVGKAKSAYDTQSKQLKICLKLLEDYINQAKKLKDDQALKNLQAMKSLFDGQPSNFKDLVSSLKV